MRDYELWDDYHILPFTNNIGIGASITHILEKDSTTDLSHPPSPSFLNLQKVPFHHSQKVGRTKTQISAAMLQFPFHHYA
jgi:hypothetical protein